MNIKKISIIHFTLLIASILAMQSQIDAPSGYGNSSFNIEPEKPNSTSTFNDPRKSKELEFNNNIVEEAIADEEAQKLKNKGIETNVIMRENLFKNEEAEINSELNAVYAIIDQDLGGFTSAANAITISCRDFQYPDGDTVTIYINNKPVIQNLVLGRETKSFTLPLVKGLNEISFKALNQGFSGPNTAAFVIVDEKGELISSNEWNLATGAKATLSIAKID